MVKKSVDHSPWWLALAGIFGAIVGAVITGGFNYLGHQGDLDAKMIELSVGILTATPTTKTIPLREWAIDVIDKRARFSFNSAQRAALLQEELPFKGEIVWGENYDAVRRSSNEGSRSLRESLKPPIVEKK